MVNTSNNVYVMVKWIEEESWDVLPLKLSVQPVSNPKSLVGKVVDFYWKKGEESAPCTVLAYGKQNDMEKERSDVVAEPSTSSSEGETSKLGVGLRCIRKPYRLDDSDEDEILQLPKKKKQKQGPNTTSVQILQKVQQRQENDEHVTPPPCKCEKYSSLKEKYGQMKLKCNALTEEVNSLRVYKDLSDIVDELKAYKDAVLKGHGGVTNREEEEAPLASSVSPPVVSSALPQDVKQSSKIDIGHGVLMEKGQLMAITQASDGATKLIRNLFVALFPLHEVIGKSMTGKKSNAHLGTSAEKERLDPIRITAITDFTVKKYPGASTTLLRQSLSNKIKEMNKHTN